MTASQMSFTMKLYKISLGKDCLLMKSTKFSKTALIRGALTAIGFHLVAWCLTVFLNCVGLPDFGLFYACIIGLILIPVYFKVMGWETAGFGLAFIVCHLLFCLIEWLILTNISDAMWDVLAPGSAFLQSAGYVLAHLVLLVEGCFSPAIDGLICLVRKCEKGREF